MNPKTILSLAAAIMWAMNAAFIAEPSRGAYVSACVALIIFSLLPAVRS